MRFALLMAVAIATAGQPGSAQQAGRHPDRRYLDESIPVMRRIRLNGPRTVLPVSLAEPAVASIGGEDPSEDLLFVDVSSVGFVSSGNIAVVDRRVQNLRLFDSRGRLLQKLGRAGQGPGEFRAPHTVHVTPGDELWVVDMQRRLTVYAPSQSGYAIGRITPVEGGIRGLCRLGEHIVANGVSTTDGTVIRLMDSTGRSLRSFGKLYTSPNLGVNLQFAEGLVACDGATGIIVYASNAALGEVRGYRPDGRLVWRTIVDGLESNMITEIQGGGIQVSAGKNGAHALLSLTSIPGVGVMLQYGHRTPAQMAAKEGAGVAATIMLDPSNGAGVLSAAVWPRIAAIAGTRAVAVFEDPAPRLELREIMRRR